MEIGRSDPNNVELRWIFTVIKRWWWLITGFVILAVVIAYYITSIIPPVYEASSMLLVNPSKDSSTSQYNDLMAGTQLALTYSQMVKDRPVLEAVISDLQLKVTADELAERITAEPVRNSQIIQLSVTDTNPERAALIANSLAQAFTRRVEDLSARRYASTVKNAKDQMDNLQVQIKDLQTQIDGLRSQKVTKDIALTNDQTLLVKLQSDYQSLQNIYQDLQLTLAEVTGKVYIVEPVQVQKNLSQATSSATAVVSIGADNRLALTYGQLIVGPTLLQGVIDELGLTESVNDLSKKIQFEAVTGTQLIRFTIVDSDDIRAQGIAQSLINAFVAQVKVLLAEPYSDRLKSIQKQTSDMEGSINQVQTDIGTLTPQIAQMTADLSRLETDLTAVRSDYRVVQQNYEQVQTIAVESSDAVIITQPAQAPKSPSQNRLLFIVVGAFFGLTLGTASAFLLKYGDVKIRTDQDIRSILNLPLLSAIGQFPGKKNDLVMSSDPLSSIAEDFRVLVNKIRLISENASIKTLLITSPVPREGKSLIVANLAIGLSKIGLRIVLIDIDLRRPRLHKMFGLTQSDGLSNYLIEGNLNGSLQSTGIGELRVLTSGVIPKNPAEMLNSPYLVTLLQELKEKTDLILIDCPPVLVASDASILASKVDGVLLVLRAGLTESKTAREALEALEQVKAKLVGVVLNSVPDHRKNYSYYRRN